MRPNSPGLLAALGFCLLCAQAVAQPDPYGAIRDGAELRAQLEGVALTDQAGRPFSFSQLRGNIILLNFIFTRCAGICPVQTQQLKQVRAQIAQAHPGIELKLVSVSLTPEWDTPEVLADYTRQYDIPADGSWLFLTGEKASVAAMMNALGMKTSASDDNFLDHLANVYLFDRDSHLKKQYDGVRISEQRLVSEIVGLNRVSKGA